MRWSTTPAEDFSKAGRVYDTVFDTVGKSGFLRSLKSLIDDRII